MKEEIWKAVPGYEGYYEASNMGRIRSLKRKATNGKVLRGSVDKDGYLCVHISTNNKAEHKRVHRIIAETFVEGHDDEHNQVNHKNEIKSDNRAENLEWCNAQYNATYNNIHNRRGLSRRRKIIAIKGDERIVFDGLCSAARYLNVGHSNISSCASHKYGRNTVKGYRFEYI